MLIYKLSKSYFLNKDLKNDDFIGLKTVKRETGNVYKFVVKFKNIEVKRTTFSAENNMNLQAKYYCLKKGLTGMVDKKISLFSRDDLQIILDHLKSPYYNEIINPIGRKSNLYTKDLFQDKDLKNDDFPNLEHKLTIDDNIP